MVDGPVIEEVVNKRIVNTEWWVVSAGNSDPFTGARRKSGIKSRRFFEKA